LFYGNVIGKKALFLGEIGLTGPYGEFEGTNYKEFEVNMLQWCEDFNVSYAVWIYETGNSNFRLFNTSVFPYTLNDAGIALVTALGGDLNYTLEISGTTPESASTHISSTLNYEFTADGNDTVSETQVALFYSNYTQVGTNQTSLTGTFNALVNESYIIACSLVGVNGAIGYLEVPFTVAIPPEPTPSPSSSVPPVVYPSVSPSETPFIVPSDDVTPSSSVPVGSVDWFSENMVVVGVVVAVAAFIGVTLLFARKH
ncbi:MAG: hypothetical protein WC325_11655, partial [Candidatus Bathyarchaeia archaeon]